MRDHLGYRNYQNIRVNGKCYKGLDQLEELCQSLRLKGEEWQLSLAQFLSDWLTDSETIFIQTSGSTGIPKRIKVAKSAMVASALKTVGFFSLQKNDKVLLCLSTDYIAGKMMVVRALVGGLNLIPVAVVSNPMKEFAGEVDFSAMVASQVQTIMDDDLSALKRIKK